ncbi:2-hydroxy-acid oxidase [Tumebacillus algifaecis]|uniref:D-lactate dehydrogenase (cytochrome) n=1 Tax=Tumebacillus algifaecis TaxID=1214604 RepID=A0A223CYC7_9BACL|nr:FAD-linked oxidase C-terminal domain-containing protein [Tumebacillus algifaecis]ASS74123.1 2-hydroxy-acid oxidase [Tumebacillus algifaecis]
MSLAEALRTILTGPEQVSVNETVLEHHSKDVTSYHPGVTPDVVVFPTTTEEVSLVMQHADQNGIPVVPFGIGSSVEGQVVPIRGGISMDFTQMNSVLEVRAEDFLVRVQPGVTRLQLNQHLKEYGLFFPVDPGADATLGGMAATNASGTTAVRYGTMRDNVLGLTVVTADGSVITTGGLAAKSSAGYNLTGLFVGSEGTLGTFTELTLRVYGIPEYTLAARAVFPDVRSASQAAMGMMMCGVTLDRVELVDEHTVKVVNKFKGTEFTEAPTLFVEVSGNKAAVDHSFLLAQEILTEEGCLELEFDSDGAARTRMWTARHEAAFAFSASQPGKKLMTTDVCVPLSALPDAIVEARIAIDENGLDGAILGHVGDGNYHAVLVVDPENPEDMRRASHVNQEIVRFALERGGTCTGEHGIGLGKAKFLPAEHGAGAVQMMQAIKRLLDPKDILNPGKIFQ